MREIAAHPLMLLGSDGIFGERPHPRVAGSAARFLGRLALRDGLVPAEEAIARLTARAADRFGLDDRGRIEVGKRADLVLLDPAPTWTPQPTRSRCSSPTASPESGSAASAPGRTARRPAPAREASSDEDDEMPSIAAERAARRHGRAAAEGDDGAPLPQHVREAVRRRSTSTT